MSTTYTIDQCIKATELYRAGKPYKEIAEQTGILYGSIGMCVKKIAGKRGLTRGRGGDRLNHQKATPNGATREAPQEKYPKFVSAQAAPTSSGSHDFHNFRQILKTIVRSNMGDTMKLLVIDELLGV